MKNTKINSDSFNEETFEELKKKYKLAIKGKNEKVRLEAFINLGSLYYESKKYEESEYYLLKALSFFSGKKSGSKLSLVYKTLGLVNLRLFNLVKAEEYLKKALDLTSKKNKRVISFIHETIGDVYTRMSKNSEGLKFYFSALALRKELEFHKGIAETLNKIGVNYYYQSDYEKAMTYLNESLKMREERKEKKESIAACLNNLCLTHFRKGEYQKALEYGLMAEKLFKESNNFEGQGMAYNNLGLIYFEMSLFSEALECQFKALKIKEDTNNKSSIANTLGNIGMIFTKLFNLEKALEYSTEGLKLREEINDMRGISYSYNEIGRIYDKMNDFDKAIWYLSESIRIKRELSILSGLPPSLENLGMVYLKQKKYEDAEKCLFEAKK
ncbi:MAG: tetratricopeptide repeat protein [Candidatus Delongbacteria bacterium]|nr:tetratricopeptide repeat protein [Candidatus Delongbacteria bacterium]